jgi:hypothetical protein
MAVSAAAAADAPAVGSSVVLGTILVPSAAARFWMASRGPTRYCAVSVLCVRRAGATYGKLGGSTSPAHCERAVVAAAVRAGVGSGRVDDGVEADDRQTLGLAQG